MRLRLEQVRTLNIQPFSWSVARSNFIVYSVSYPCFVHLFSSMNCNHVTKQANSKQLLWNPLQYCEMQKTECHANFILYFETWELWPLACRSFNSLVSCVNMMNILNVSKFNGISFFLVNVHSSTLFNGKENWILQGTRSWSRQGDENENWNFIILVNSLALAFNSLKNVNSIVWMKNHFIFNKKEKL